MGSYATLHLSFINWPQCDLVFKSFKYQPVDLPDVSRWQTAGTLNEVSMAVGLWAMKEGTGPTQDFNVKGRRYGSSSVPGGRPGRDLPLSTYAPGQPTLLSSAQSWFIWTGGDRVCTWPQTLNTQVFKILRRDVNFSSEKSGCAQSTEHEPS